MRKSFIAIAFTLMCVPVFSQQFVSTVGAPNGGLFIARTDGKSALAPRLPGQTHYVSPLVSDSRRYVSWVVSYDFQESMAASGSILVVMREDNKYYKFESAVGDIDSWCFSKDDMHVVIREVPNFRLGLPIRFERRRLTDGKRDAIADIPLGKAWNVSELPPPVWAKCLLD